MNLSSYLPKKTSRILYLCVAVLFVVVAQGSATIRALSPSDLDSIYHNAVWYVGAGGQCIPTGSTAAISGSNLDYAGRPILNQGELAAVKANTSTYQQAAQQVGIPWQVLAALHYREHDLRLVAPDETGVYQITDSGSRTAGNYPPAGTTLTQQQFLQESIDAANFIKKKEPSLSSQPSAAIVKNAFGLYNGLPPLYGQQAADLGFDKATQAYEGSPYVMNMADAQRDPHIPSVVSSGKWLQYLTPTSTQPASTGQYGAFVVYASLAGLTLGGDCSTGSVNCSSAPTATSGLSQVRQNIVCVAEQELALWNSGAMKAGKDFFKYSEGRNELWCADFVSRAYNQAGYPLGPAGSPTNNWNIAYTGNLSVPPQDGSKFVRHLAAGYTPKPGDMALHYDSNQNPPYYHVNIVVSVTPTKILLIGGDQHGSGGPEGNIVSEVPLASPTADGVLEYVGPD